MLDTIDTTNDETGAPAAPVSSPTRLKGIAVCGSQPQTKMLAPFADESVLIYACSPDNTPYGLNGPPHCSPLPRVDEWFEVHDPVFDRSRPYAYLEWIASTQKRVWMRDRVAMTFKTQHGAPLFPNAALYPEKAVKERFGPFTFTSSIALMMAKAILDIEALKAAGRLADDAPPTLGLYGILQASKNEYTRQRQGTQNMMWAATQAGIKVLVHPASRLLEPPPEDF